jgi:Flp pilus assembly protein TadG
MITPRTTTVRFADTLRRFRVDKRGNVAMIFGLAIVPLLLAAGIAIDFARSTQSGSQLQAAVDSAALSIASSELADMTGLTQTQKEARQHQLEQLAQDYVNANYKATGGDTDSIDISVRVDDGLIIVDGAHKLDTTIMNVIGIAKVDLGAHAEVNMEDGAIAGVEPRHGDGYYGLNGRQ